MNSLNSYFYALYCLAIVTLSEALTKLSVEECFEVGLNRAHLLCSSCDSLKEFGLNEILESNCRKCCDADDDHSEPVKYPKAQLEHSLRVTDLRLSQILPLSKYVRGADPIIKLMDEEGVVMETLAIDKWNTDSVEEFLKTYLILDIPDPKENEI
ncbi:selenoprotein [Armadillidium nasatum]|uniref:Selenoprotein F n=2 Tax=Armadillidium nasatum TaxID=96803 RepID=A0A5N5T434_9CRUS|nr:selenoprotein [Armadillidium nasatum]